MNLPAGLTAALLGPGLGIIGYLYVAREARAWAYVAEIEQHDVALSISLRMLPLSWTRPFDAWGGVAEWDPPWPDESRLDEPPPSPEGGSS